MMLSYWATFRVNELFHSTCFYSAIWDTGFLKLINFCQWSENVSCVNQVRRHPTDWDSWSGSVPTPDWQFLICIVSIKWEIIQPSGLMDSNTFIVRRTKVGKFYRCSKWRKSQKRQDFCQAALVVDSDGKVYQGYESQQLYVVLAPASTVYQWYGRRPTGILLFSIT